MKENLNEQSFANKIKGHLDNSLDLGGRQLARLQSARDMALRRQRTTTQLQLVPATLGRSLAAIGIGPTAGRVLLPIAVVAAAMLGYQEWTAQEQPREPDDPISEIDADILKSDLPIDAYLDRGFNAWLKRDGEQ